MDITKFYELRKRLYSAAASGTATVSEDFRLKRAVQEFGAEMASSKPMMKLYALCGELFTAANPADKLAECIALADALAVVQGGFSDSSETAESTVEVYETNGSQFTYSEINSAVSQLSALNWQLFYDGDTKKELFMDTRVLAAFLKILDRAELHPISFIFSENYGKRLVPILKNNFTRFSDKAKVNSIRLIGKIAGAEENELYVSLAADENQSTEVRAEAVLAMRYSSENAERLTEIYRTEKGKIRSAALTALGRSDIPETAEIWEKLLENDKKSDLKYLSASCSHIITEYVRKEIFGAIDDFRNSSDHDRSVRLFRLCDMLRFTYDCEDILITLVNQDLMVNNIRELLIENIREYPYDERYKQLIEKVCAEAPQIIPAWYLMNLIYSDSSFIENNRELYKKYYYHISLVVKEIRFCGAVGKYIMPFSYLYPRGGNRVAVPEENVKCLVKLLSDTEELDGFIDTDKACRNPIERIKLVKQFGGEAALHRAHLNIMRISNDCCLALENLDKSAAAALSLKTAAYCPGMESVGVLYRNNILNSENAEELFSRYMLFVAKHYTIKKTEYNSCFSNARQILGFIPMTDEGKLSELISLKKKLRLPMLAADTAMLEESRKFTDELILQFQNKTKGALK
ncbi:MAG: HEAT repeat domain-containing protein [Huintestinicola sp.]|uniref:HEAT repeat domain-containing protein n=1 Tax=Huintestinicola sp. TaxID=2981661 RepID=UPI003EFBE6F4